MTESGRTLLLIPRPRALVLTGGLAAGAHLPPAVVHDPAADLRFPGPESYRLELASHGPPRMLARTPAGLRLAGCTLEQIRRHREVPALVIDDAPRFPTRGVMLDVSRDRVPTMQHLLETVDHLAALKFNHLQLYVEHTFAYAGHEEVWRGWSPLTAHEIRRLDGHCRDRGIALAANQNCFGHLASWLRHPRYAPLAETHGEWFFEHAGARFPRSGPFSLCPIDPRSLDLVEDLLAQLLPCFASPLVNIGCDETFDVGYGRSRAEVARRGRAAVYFDFVAAVAAIVRRHGKRPMVWADIALSHPQDVARIPGDAIALAWGYEPGTPFDDWCRLLAGRETWVCPGTSSWRSITGRTAERRANLAEAARLGASAGAAGYLVTDWGDTGHHQQWPVALLAIAEAADAAWGEGAPFDPRAASLQVLSDPTLQVGPWLDALGDADLPLRHVSGRPGPDGAPGRLRNSSALFTDLHTPLRTPWGPQDPHPWSDTLARLEALAASRPPVPSSLVRDELDHTVAVARLAARRALARRAPDARWGQLADLARAVRADHQRLWTIRSRSGGLDHSTAHYDRLIADLDSAEIP